jgi:hypothetical protein
MESLPNRELFLASFVLILIPLLSVQADQNRCLQPRDRGDSSCDKSGSRKFYYDKVTKHCQPFMYEGCGGNENRFGSAAECRKQCSNVTDDGGDGHGGHTGMVIDVPKCEGGVRAAINENSQPLKCDDCPKGYTCEKDVCCPPKDLVCSLEYDTGKYAFMGSHTPRYFYSKNVKNCLLFTYYGALGNANNFETYKECIKFCK